MFLITLQKPHVWDNLVLQIWPKMPSTNQIAESLIMNNTEKNQSISKDFSIDANHQGKVKALARKLKLLTFSRYWKTRQVFTKGCHHGWRQKNIFRYNP